MEPNSIELVLVTFFEKANNPVFTINRLGEIASDPLRALHFYILNTVNDKIKKASKTKPSYLVLDNMKTNIINVNFSIEYKGDEFYSR